MGGSPHGSPQVASETVVVLLTAAFAAILLGKLSDPSYILMSACRANTRSLGLRLLSCM